MWRVRDRVPRQKAVCRGTRNRSLRDRIMSPRDQAAALGARRPALWRRAGTRKKLSVSWPVSRVLFGDLHLRDGHSSGTPIAKRLVQPTRVRGLKTGSMPDVATRMRSLLFGLAPGGVCRAAAVTSTRGALLPPRFTLTARDLRRGRRFVFCGTFPRVAPGGR
jgi:hypothetical protein